jgi:hypothetical protein
MPVLVFHNFEHPKFILYDLVHHDPDVLGSSCASLVLRYAEFLKLFCASFHIHIHEFLQVILCHIIYFIALNFIG